MSGLIQDMTLDREHTHFFAGDRYSGAAMVGRGGVAEAACGEAWSVCLGGERQELSGVWMRTN